MDPLLRSLNRHHVRYLLIGGQAIRMAGMPRFTMDWDLFIPNRDEKNMIMLNTALSDYLDLPVEHLGPRGQNFVQTYQTQWGVIQFHLAPIGIPSFDEVESRAVDRRTENGTTIKCISDEDLLKAKIAANRARDQDDIHFLKLKLGTRD